MKNKFLLIAIAGSIITMNAAAQPKQNAEKDFVVTNVRDTCPEPQTANFKLWCGDIATRGKVSGAAADTVEYIYERRLWEMACAKMGVDDDETAKKKIQD